MTLSLLLIWLGLAGAAFFAGSETAFVTLFRSKDATSKLSSAIMRWLEKPGELFSVTLIGTNICYIISGAVSAELFIRHFGGIGEIYSLVVISFLSLVFSEVLPKSRALAVPESFAKFSTPILNIAGKLFAPAILAADAITNAVRKTLKTYIKPEPPASWEEFEKITRGGKLDLAGSQKDMLLLLFELSDRTAFDEMLPIRELVKIPMDDAAFSFEPETRIAGNLVLVENSKGEIIGYVNKSKLISSFDRKTKDIAKKPFYVPENTPILKLFSDMSSAGADFALVVDEHGTATGGISYEDLTETLCGRPHRSGYSRLKGSGKTFIAEGTLPLELLEESIEREFPKGPYKTVAGFVQEIAHDTPPEGAIIKWKNLKFVVVEKDARRIIRIKILI